MAKGGHALAETFDAVITGLDEAGRGIGKMPSGKTFFCEGVFPGEKITCRETSSSARFSVCEAVSVITSSPSRLSPFAPGKPICGGLPLAALAYPAQLDFKASRVRECLERIGHFDNELLDSVMQPIAACEPPVRYRNHMQYAISGGRVGLLASQSHELADYDGEKIEYEVFSRLRGALEKCFERAPTNLFEEVNYPLNPEIKTENFVSTNDNKIKKWSSAVKNLRNLVQQQQPDVVIGIMELCSLLAKICTFGTQIPVIATDHYAFERPQNSPFSKQEWFLQFLQKLIRILSAKDSKK